MMQTVNILQPQLTIDVVDQVPTVNVVEQQLTLDIDSGGIVPAAVDTTLEAAQDISALRCITTDGTGKAVYANNNTLANAMVIGISSTAATTGTNVTIKTTGLMTDAFWSFTKGPVFLGTNGTLTQTAPSNGSFVVQVARAITATTIIIDIDTTIQTV